MPSWVPVSYTHLDVYKRQAFVHSLDKDDIAFEDIDENFGEEYKLFLKRDQGRIDMSACAERFVWLLRFDTIPRWYHQMCIRDSH